MDWVELAVETTSLGAEAVSALLISAGALGTQIIDRADLPEQEALDAAWALMDDSVKNQMPAKPVVKAWFQDVGHAELAREAIAKLQRAGGFDAGSLAVTQGAVQEEAWAESWKNHFHPIKVGRFVIRPTWEAYEAGPRDLVIDMDPGMAFGTGWHETTRLCLQLIEQYYRGGRALDLGTGSGILALALGKLGARDVLAVDIDPGAVRAAGENAAQNGLSEVIEVRQGDLTQGIVGSFAFACANILADAIIVLAKPLKPLMMPGGVFVASGIVKERAGDVTDALVCGGWRLMDQALEGEWAALAFEA
ncbi:MAG: 50S ribosomal protein L11 methyltransferase [Eubacteriales bacterium]|nr:50S ribosomal protein L11 methyltransferase [Eubacteriales bacterium]